MKERGRKHSPIFPPSAYWVPELPNDPRADGDVISRPSPTLTELDSVYDDHPLKRHRANSSFIYQTVKTYTAAPRLTTAQHLALYG